jgi:hypothetical protein
VLALAVLLSCTLLQFYHVFTNLHLNEVGLACCSAVVLVFFLLVFAHDEESAAAVRVAPRPALEISSNLDVIDYYYLRGDL